MEGILSSGVEAFVKHWRKVVESEAVDADVRELRERRVRDNRRIDEETEDVGVW